MKDTDYAYCAARLRAIESKMLTDSDFEKMSSLDFEKCVQYLKSKNWIGGGNNISEYLNNQRILLWDTLEKSVPDKKELDVFLVLNDFFNIKAAVKGLITGKNVSSLFLYPTTIDTENVKEKLLKRDFVSAFKLYGEKAKKAYEAAVKTENGQSCDIILDRAALECCLKYSEEKKYGITGEICVFLCDSTNIKIALRCAKAKKNEEFVDAAISKCKNLKRDELIKFALKGEKELISYLLKTPYSEGAKEYLKGGGEYENWCDKETLKIASKGNYTCFSFSPVCSYYYKRTNEIKKVGHILRMKERGELQ